MLLIILISAFFNPFALLTIKNSSALLGAYSLPVNFSFSLFNLCIIFKETTTMKLFLYIFQFSLAG